MKKIRYIFAVCLLVVGLATLLYPFVSALINERSQTAVILDYEAKLRDLADDKRGQLFDEATAYNQNLAGNQRGLLDPFGTEDESSPEIEISFLKLGEVMGYVQIPKIGIKIPIYEGTSEAVLQKGAGWLKGTSLPVGGASTHSVLAGHRGLPTAKLFTDLDRLKEGDEFFIRNSSGVLAYRVFETKIVDPSDTEALQVVQGEDRVTLLTCHPYMINNQRLLVTGERVPYADQLDEAENSKGILKDMTAVEKDFLIILLILLWVAVVIWLWRRVRRRKLRRRI